MKKKRIHQNWLTRKDYENLFFNCGFKIVKSSREIACPIYIPLISRFLNTIIPCIPVLRNFCLLEHFVVSKKEMHPDRQASLSCSVLIPCKNEEENIPLILERMPKMGTFTEILFVNDASTDRTGERMLEARERHPEFRINIFQGEGKGKGAACRKGFEHATGDVLMILDADLTVVPEVLPDFFEILESGVAEFVNGSRMVYELEKNSMRFANRLGNIFFSGLFSWITGLRINDTLCGTKVCLRKDYSRILETRTYLGEKDVWGDFDWIFGAARHNLIYTELPVHYFPRNFGETKMTRRLANAMIMLKHCRIAYRKLKAF